MRRNATHAMGALHPVVFFVLMYVIALVLALFVCRTVYFSLQDSNASSTPAIPEWASPNANTTASVR